MGVIGFKKAKCKDCYKCVRLCEVKAIRVKNEHAHFVAKDCVLCGQCLESCPQHAITFISDLEKVKTYIRDGVKTVVSLAPSYLGVFPDLEPGKIKTALNQLGFTYVRETAEGAAYLTDEYVRILNEGQMNVILTASCPSINDYIEKYHPDMIQYMAPLVTPATAHGKLLKSIYGEDIKIIYIASCIAEGRRSFGVRAGQNVIDAVVDFRELREWFRAEEIDPQLCESGSFDNGNAGVMNMYALSGGMMSAIKARNNGTTGKYNRLYVSSIHGCGELFDCIRRGEIKNTLVELNACISGCINGPESGNDRSGRFIGKIGVSSRVGRELPDYPPLPEGISLHKEFIGRESVDSTPTEEEIRTVLAKINKDTPNKELNCGACGYPTCREKAVAVVHGKAELGMCIPYMYEQARSLSDVILTVTPNMVIIVDENMRIREFNNAAEVRFAITREKALKSYLYEIIPVGYFQQAFDEERSVLNRQVEYATYGLMTMQNIIYMREHKLALGIIRDITSEEREKERFHKVKMDTVQMAQNVINKQMMVAQEIAGLLGETTAETKVTLRKLKDTLMYNEDVT